jgi:hypothetical protein
MKGHEITAAMKRRNEADIRRAKMTWAQRKKSMAREDWSQYVWEVGFIIGGLACGIDSYTDLLVLFACGVLGPIALRYDLL